MEDCLVIKQNLGLSKCIKLPAMPRGMITTYNNFFFTPEQTATPAAFKTAVEAAIVAGYASRIYLWPFFSGFENATEPAVYEENAYGSQHVRNGRYRFRFQITKGLCVHTAMFTHKATSGRAYVYDIEGQLQGTVDEDGNFYGFSINLLNPENLILSDGTVATKSPIYVVLDDPNELNKNGRLIDASFLNTIDRLTDVSLTKGAGVATTSLLFVKAALSCDGTILEGLAFADWTLTSAAGVSKTADLTGATYNATTQQYELTSVADFVAGDIVSLISPAGLSIKAYEVKDKYTVVIP